MLERIFVVVVEIEIDTNFLFPTGNDVENSSDVFVSASVSIKNGFVEKLIVKSRKVPLIVKNCIANGATKTVRDFKHKQR